MKICAAQIRPVKGNIPLNIIKHKRFIEEAVSHKTDIIIFPELSLTGYEPLLAKALATTPDDTSLDDFQTISNDCEIIIGVGLPLRTILGINIGMIIFQPRKERKTYCKRFIHVDEEEYFVPGNTPGVLDIKDKKVGLAICYEISVTEHAQKAKSDGAQIYLASVAKSGSGVSGAYERLSKIARDYTIQVVMSDSIGPCDNFESAGMSAAWMANGVLAGRLDSKNEGLLIFDSESQLITKIAL